MEAAGYPDIVQHTAEHALIEMALGRTMKFVHSEDVGATLDFTLALLLSHQSDADRSLEAFLKRRFKP
ncbi:hypothetical protein [Azospirillum rugosum]|uniref:Hemerythrin n=1 Tax=Azospirillum rugosum TaxID=416170 RepID=A0ABS4STX4_9PROT|nr:hypothetical protein [Azospirillum rugosum]MBP2295417.1 hemerythrin [Azospirillum rugosum]MDQ0528792.1 hemerythrin [Azospirillum rugosum]